MIEFVDITIEDASVIRQWIKTNEFTKKWYYQNKIPQQKTLEKKLSKKLQQKNTYAKIVVFDGKKIGYIQGYPVDGNGNWTRQVYIKPNVASIDYFIGDINYIHKGYGQKIICEFIEKIIKPKGYAGVMISPDPENIASTKCCQKCGLEYIKTVGIPYDSSKNKEAVFYKDI